ncbi:MAG: lipid-A-disaccharide synthase [Alphaproteobacteria bacterium]|nr:lipid-A-disaccharide synthase [Alphaproteobacteria bacterium]
MKKNIKIFIIAGEVSGDVLGAKIIRELSGVRFAGIGGEHMRAAGLKSLFPISDLAVMGFFEVLARAKTLTRRINETVLAIEKFQPDIVLSIDAPGFAKRVVKKARKARLSAKFYHVVAPQVWAWGEKRAKKFAKIFDRLYAFFDFEVPYFTKYGLETVPVGHPIADGLKPVKKDNIIKNIALIPGSRMSEVRKLLPIFRRFVEQISFDGGQKYKFYIPIVETTEKYIRKETADWPVRPALVPAMRRYDLFAKTGIAIAASGTVSAELAIMHIPAIVVYKMNPLTMFLARLVLKTEWVSLVNILLKKKVYSELLGGDATPENIMIEFQRLENPVVRKKMISELSDADKIWTRGGKSAAKLIAFDIMKV